MSNTKKATRPASELEPAAEATAQTEATERSLKATYEGHDYIIDADAFDDLLLLDDIASVDDGQVQRMPSIIRRIIGDEQWREFVERHKGENGRLPTEHALKLFEQLNTASGN